MHDFDPHADLITMATLLLAIYPHFEDRWTGLSFHLSCVTLAGHVDLSIKREWLLFKDCSCIAGHRGVRYLAHSGYLTLGSLFSEFAFILKIWGSFYQAYGNQELTQSVEKVGSYTA